MKRTIKEMEEIEEIKKDRIEAIKEFIANNGLENSTPQDVANIYNLVDYLVHYKK